jgi:hypothetical protein
MAAARKPDLEGDLQRVATLVGAVSELIVAAQQGDESGALAFAAGELADVAHDLLDLAARGLGGGPGIGFRSTLAQQVEEWSAAERRTV